MRSGTMNVPGIVGMGMACELAASELSDEAARLKQLRDRLETGMAKNISHIYVNGHPTKRLPGTSNISFAFVEGEAMMMKLRNIAVSSGSACTSESLEPSHVLKAMNVPAELAHSSIRFSLGKYTTADDIDYAIAEVTRAVDELRQLSPLYEMAMQGINIGEIKWTKG